MKIHKTRTERGGRTGSHFHQPSRFIHSVSSASASLGLPSLPTLSCLSHLSPREYLLSHSTLSGSSASLALPSLPYLVWLLCLLGLTVSSLPCLAPLSPWAYLLSHSTSPSTMQTSVPDGQFTTMLISEDRKTKVIVNNKQSWQEIQTVIKENNMIGFLYLPNGDGDILCMKEICPDLMCQKQKNEIVLQSYGCPVHGSALLIKNPKSLIQICHLEALNLVNHVNVFDLYQVIDDYFSQKSGQKESSLDDID